MVLRGNVVLLDGALDGGVGIGRLYFADIDRALRLRG